MNIFRILWKLVLYIFANIVAIISIPILLVSMIFSITREENETKKETAYDEFKGPANQIKRIVTQRLERASMATHKPKNFVEFLYLFRKFMPSEMRNSDIVDIGEDAFTAYFAWICCDQAIADKLPAQDKLIWYSYAMKCSIPFDQADLTKFSNLKRKFIELTIANRDKNAASYIAEIKPLINNTVKFGKSP